MSLLLFDFCIHGSNGPPASLYRHPFRLLRYVSPDPSKPMSLQKKENHLVKLGIGVEKKRRITVQRSARKERRALDGKPSVEKAKPKEIFSLLRSDLATQKSLWSNEIGCKNVCGQKITVPVSNSSTSDICGVKFGSSSCRTLSIQAHGWSTK